MLYFKQVIDEKKQCANGHGYLHLSLGSGFSLRSGITGDLATIFSLISLYSLFKCQGPYSC